MNCNASIFQMFSGYLRYLRYAKVASGASWLCHSLISRHVWWTSLKLNRPCGWHVAYWYHTASINVFSVDKMWGRLFSSLLALLGLQLMDMLACTFPSSRLANILHPKMQAPLFSLCFATLARPNFSEANCYHGCTWANSGEGFGFLTRSVLVKDQLIRLPLHVCQKRGKCLVSFAEWDGWVKAN